jgi:hypothetical protein
MKQEDLKKSLGYIEPNEKAEQRMLQHILQSTSQKKEERNMKLFIYKKGIPALTMVLVLVAGIFLYDSMTKDNETRLSETDLRGSQEDSVAMIQNQFQIGDQHYMLLSEEQRAAFSLPDTITEKDIGEKITAITTSVDDHLIGSHVYEYLPAGGNAIVAVKKDNEYKLFKFFQFESYINNKDEDVKAYLELFGINNPKDIKKIQFIGHSEEAKIEGREDIISEITNLEKIQQFFQFYAILKDSSKEYFDKLYNYHPSSQPQTVVPDESKGSPEEQEKSTVEPVLPPDQLRENPPPDGVVTEPTQAEDSIGIDLNGKDTPITNTNPSAGYDYVDNGKTSSESTSGSEGNAGNALANAITIRIYNQFGVYFETVYYPNLGFISRHRVNEEFASFLAEFL